ncbi:bifunctional 3-(3-hydroxy-phenyl)propionate/3-hydroxycinnamic acid hydroxylase [Mycobacterium sp. shizuoka-1]|uniref:bifunctional 3-(3-hydroxy-phenyl)propionate/3-hydroxycinnamic acid hydroxylase MhpA n=1 Tax=Mycobacterium sp. shizuoka-1 TaxID=2039281 RepID=UPI000C05F554|nr:bifunctional 3-(3-hydroxy-phenyl)propionate/3-hydroxycinnamic acid hydroxylase [Mycobacterium sp. shizuoka-1]GAY19087.1 3-(3-hydroxyphenyl)propionate hydroxylase [Mycobacterium sp. shizuoka-1]
MSSIDPPSVVIIGAGPTGTTAATLLAQYGVRSLVLDRYADVYPQPRAVHLDDEVYRILHRLGIADEFATISRPALGLRLLDPQMRVLAEFNRDPARTPHGYPQANMFDQPELEGLLRVNLARHPLATLRGDVEVTDVATIADGRTRVTYTDRSGGREHTVDAAYVLGCDGANSLVRARIGSTMRDLRFEQRWLVVDVATDTDLGQWAGVHQLCDPHRAGTFMQIGEVRYRWEFRLLPGETAADFDTLETLGPLIAPWTSRADAADLELIRVAEYTFRAQIADRWRRGNVFLLGDAAHLTPPFVGQGMGAGLRDSMNLTWKLAGVINHTLSPAVLDTYETERKPHARKMIDLALMVGRAMTSGGTVGNMLRRNITPQIHRLPGLRERVVDSRTPPLHRSALVYRSRRPGQLGGTLCPNTLDADGRRLDDVLGSGFALVTTRAPGAAEGRAAGKYGLSVHVPEPGSDLAKWLHHGHAEAAIIRPDRSVLGAGRDVGELIRLLGGHLVAVDEDQRAVVQ